jgi:hypothetical protein
LASLAADHPMGVAVQTELEACERDVARLETTRQGLENAWQALSALARNVEDYLADTCVGIAIEVHPREVLMPALAKGEGYPDLVERLRRRGRELQNDRLKIECAPISSSAAKTLVRARIEELSQRGLNLTGLIDRGDISCIAAPIRRITEVAYTAVGAGLQPGVTPINVAIDDCLAMLAWLDPSKLLKRLFEEIDQAADDGEALDDEMRAQLLAEVDRDLLEAQRAEAMAIEAADSEGVSILPRPQIDPRAHLSLAETMPAAKEG